MTDWITLPSGESVNLDRVVRARWARHSPAFILEVGRDPRAWIWLRGVDADYAAALIESRSRRSSRRRRSKPSR